jgi:hypothetical protein
VYALTDPMPTKQLPILVIVPVDDEGEPLEASRKAHAELKRVVAKHRGRASLVYALPSRHNAYRRMFGLDIAHR